MSRTSVTLLAASLSLALLAGCKQDAATPGTAGDAANTASGMQAAVEQAEGDAQAALPEVAGDAPLKPGQRVQGTIQLDIGQGPASYRSLATKVDDDLGKKTAERLGSSAGQDDLANAKAKVGGGANVSSKDIQELADAFAGKTLYTSEMRSLSIIHQRQLELAGIAADGRRTTLTISFPMDSDTPTGAKLEFVPDGKKRMQAFESDRNANETVQVTLDRFEHVNDDTLSIAGSFKADTLSPTILAKDLAGQTITGASGTFDFTEVHVRPAM